MNCLVNLYVFIFWRDLPGRVSYLVYVR